jgi:hypothetical protein
MIVVIPPNGHLSTFDEATTAHCQRLVVVMSALKENVCIAQSFARRLAIVFH